MIEPLLTESLDRKALVNNLTNSAQVSATLDQTFDEVFNSIGRSDRGRDENLNKIRHEANREPERKFDRKDDFVDRSDDVEHTREYPPPTAPIAPPAEQVRPIRQDEQNSQDDELEANDDVATNDDALQKIQQLLDLDPMALRKMMADNDISTFGDLLRALGFDDAKMNELGKIVNLDLEFSLKALGALSADQRDALGAALEKMGLDRSVMEKIFAEVDNRIKQTQSAPAVALESKVDKQNSGKNVKSETLPSDITKPKLAIGKTENHGAGNGTAGKQSGQDNNGAVAKNPVNPNLIAQTPQNNASGSKPGAVAVPAEGDTSRAKNLGGRSDINIVSSGSDKTESLREVSSKPALQRHNFNRLLMEQVLDKVRANVRANGRSNMVIQLNPPELGKIDIKIMTHEQMVRATIVVENHEVRSVVENNLASLRASLSSHGLSVDEAIVLTQDQNSGLANLNFSRQGDSNHSAKNNSSNAGNEIHGIVDDDINSDHRMKTLHNGVLDVVA